jgi:hypothetical protein
LSIGNFVFFIIFCAVTADMTGYVSLTLQFYYRNVSL